jgi:integrase/recombinase XerD
LAVIKRSPNTVKAYAHDLKDWFGFLAGRGVDWRVVTVEDLAGFVAWLRLICTPWLVRLVVPLLLTAR